MWRIELKIGSTVQVVETAKRKQLMNHVDVDNARKDPRFSSGVVYFVHNDYKELIEVIYP